MFWGRLTLDDKSKELTKYNNVYQDRQWSKSRELRMCMEIGTEYSFDTRRE